MKAIFQAALMSWRVRRLRSIMNDFLVTLLILSLYSCGKESVRSESELDIPGYHYKLGERRLEEGDFKGALSAFGRSIKLDPKFAIGWGGLGYSQANLGEIENGKKSVDKAVTLDSKDARIWVWRGRYGTVAKRDKDWLEKVEKNFYRSLEILPGNEKAEYYLGVAYLQSYNFKAAESQFSRVVEKRGRLAKKANENWELCQKIVRASPGTLAGKKIAIQPEITRADLAVLFAEELKLSEIFQQRTPLSASMEFKSPKEMMKESVKSSIPADIEDFWAKPWIVEVIELGVFEVDPSGNFNPKKKITRVDYAMAIQRIIARISNDESLESRYFGETTSRFTDVPTTHFAYNAIALCKERGMMKADMLTGKFNPTAMVAGADALLIIREIQGSLRMTF